jgi:hypothetical protein
MLGLQKQVCDKAIFPTFPHAFANLLYRTIDGPINVREIDAPYPFGDRRPHRTSCVRSWNGANYSQPWTDQLLIWTSGDLYSSVATAAGTVVAVYNALLRYSNCYNCIHDIYTYTIFQIPFHVVRELHYSERYRASKKTRDCTFI